ncbi:MAG: sulfatase-like hydrolase/transferase [Thermoanaerobaculia bacterium]|nr:sulfatase-like hydrolase/transferase [Thermoanaerobaculia bacterium]
MLVAALFALCCSTPSELGEGNREARPNVLLISIDTLRADHLGSYGYARDTSPFLDSLAAVGVRFHSAFAQASWTLPSHMSLLTSTYPGTHRVETSRRALPSAIPTLAEQLQGAGYATAGYVSWIYLKSEYGFGRGFDRYVELLPETSLQDSATHHSIRSEAFVDRALEWVRDPPAQPWFLFLHLFDPHMSYEPPLDIAQRYDPSLDGLQSGSYEVLSRYIDGLRDDAPAVPPEVLRHATALYDGEVRFVDRALRRFFAALEDRGLLESTVVVVTSDHGEELDDHGSMEGHQWTLYDEVIRVPLIVVLPGSFSSRERSSRVENRMVQTIDVAPTVLELGGIEVPAEFEGRSLVPLLREESVDWEEFAFSQIRRFNLKWALRTPSHKLIYNQDPETDERGMPIRAGFELFDLVADPREQDNLYDPEDPLTQKLMARLRQLIEERPDYGAGEAPILSDEELERLKALGYAQ